MSRLLVIGCGGVASVAIQKCCQNSKVFTELCIASRTKEKCDALKEKIQDKTDTVITTAKVDADSKEELVALINSYKPDAVLNVALPYQDLTVMETPPTTSRRIRTIRSGEPSTRNAARRRALPLTLITPGSGLIRRSTRRQASPLFWEPDLTRA